MGNCFGSSTLATGPPPPKKQKTDHSHADQKYVTDKVLQLRQQADTYHQKVVACAKESQKAYQKGDKKKAHDLSEEKKKWQRQQDDANQRAVKWILAEQKWQSSGEIDLHGLYLEEALEATKTFLKHWWSKRQQSNKETVLIITGAGHHSENNKAVIRPKVAQLLRDERLEFESVHGNGAYKVYLKPTQ